MNAWFWYAVGAAVLYGAHQIFTKMASDKIGDGLGGFVVEGSAALTILAYLAALKFSGRWNQSVSAPGVWYSVLTGLCVGVGTIFFFVLFQKGGPLSAVPMILAGIFFFHEKPSLARLLGIVLSMPFSISAGVLARFSRTVLLALKVNQPPTHGRCCRLASA